MSSPYLGVGFKPMSFRGLIFWGMLGALGLAGLASVVDPVEPVMTLENTLGSDVETTRL